MNNQIGVGTTFTDRPTGSADGLGHALRAQELRSGGTVAFTGVPRRIHQRRDGDSRDIFVGRWRVATIAEDPGKDAEMCGRPGAARQAQSLPARPLRNRDPSPCRSRSRWSRIEDGLEYSRELNLYKLVTAAE
jgi:hypothetical protein